MTVNAAEIKRALVSFGYWVSSIRCAPAGGVVIQLARPLKVTIQRGASGNVVVFDQDSKVKVKLSGRDAIFVSCLCQMAGAELPDLTVKSIYTSSPRATSLARADIGVDMLRRRLREHQIEPARLFTRVRARGYVPAKGITVVVSTDVASRRASQLLTNSKGLRKPAEVAEDASTELPADERELIPVLRALGRNDAALLLQVLRGQRHRKSGPTIARELGFSDASYKRLLERFAVSMHAHGVQRELPLP